MNPSGDSPRALGEEEGARRVKLVVQYDGTDFAGWQLQRPPIRTVQGCLEWALHRLTGEEVRVAAAGRTDSGVHARAQVVSFVATRRLSPRSWVHALNGMLPDDLCVLDASETPREFDPRRWALGKRYVYRVWNAPVRSPLVCRHAWHVPRPLALEEMRKAAAALVGERDFASFQAAGCAAETTIRVVERVEVTGAPGGLIVIDVTATAFLRHMVRNIAGTLVEVGLEARSADTMREVIEARSRRAAGRTAPGHGLTLEEVYYGDGPPKRRRMSRERDEELS